MRHSARNLTRNSARHSMRNFCYLPLTQKIFCEIFTQYVRRRCIREKGIEEREREKGVEDDDDHNVVAVVRRRRNHYHHHHQSSSSSAAALASFLTILGYCY